MKINGSHHFKVRNFPYKIVKAQILYFHFSLSNTVDAISNNNGNQAATASNNGKNKNGIGLKCIIP